MIFFIVLLIRLLLPFSILRWPLVGAILSAIADIYDINLLRAFGWGMLEESNYQAFDKTMDTYYLSFEAYVSLKWKEASLRRTSLLLYLYRFAGFIIFELTQIRKVLFFFPNIFENFYLITVALKKICPKIRIGSYKALAVIFIIAAIIKIFHEFGMHVKSLN